MKRLTLILLCTLLVDCRCGSDSPPTDAADMANDVAHVLPDATENDAADLDPLPLAVRTTSGGITVDFSFTTFGFTLSDANGNEVGRSLEPAFQFAQASNFAEITYYDPAVPNDSFEWFEPVGLLSQTGNTFELATEDGNGTPGPTATLTFTETNNAAILAVQINGDETFVQTRLSLASPDPTEGFYGLGEHFDALDMRGSIREMQVQARLDSESATNEVHVPIPFLMSTQDYGFFINDRHPGAFDVAATEGDVLHATYNTQTLDVSFLADDDPMVMIEQFTNITGKPAHIPYWAFAPHWWRNVNRDQAELLDDAARGRAADVPSGVVWIDRPWSSNYHNWRFNPSQFPDPPAMFTELERLGYKVMLHHSPQVALPGQTDLGTDEDNSDNLYELYDTSDWLVRLPTGAPFVFSWGGGTAGFVDWTSDGAVAHVQNLITRVTDLGVVGTKMDWDEYIAPNFTNTRLRLQFSNGETSDTMHRTYSALYHKAIIEGFNAGAGEPTFHVSRSGAIGDQVWNTCIWPGDLDSDFSIHTRAPSAMQEDWNVGGLPAAIYANQSLGFVGYPCFASDIGGFRDGLPNEEVLIRWTAFGTFNGVMQLGGGGSSHMPWTADTTYTQTALDVVRTYFDLRMRLFPYIREQFLDARFTGRPVVRSMYLAFGEEARAFEDQFMFGPDILVAPVYEAGVTERTFWLPDGDWIDWWTGERLTGPMMVTRPAPLDTIPILLRAGAVIPMAAPGIDTLVETTDVNTVSYLDVNETHVRIVPEGDTTHTFFNGLFVRSSFSGTLLEVGWDIDAPSPDVDARIAFNPQTVAFDIEGGGWLSGAPSSVSVVRDAVATELVEGTNCDDCWSWDAARTLLTVRLSTPGLVTVAP